MLAIISMCTGFLDEERQH